MSQSGDAGSGNITIDDVYVSGANASSGDSAFSGRTMATTATSYRHENGRTYHAYRDGEYWQPNDDKSNNHEAILHHMCLMSLNDRLYLAPVENPGQILDVGTGTGIWASDVADRFSGEGDLPYAEVIGTDLSPIQPGSPPINCRFEVDDCCSEWIYEPNSFGFVHIRGLYASVADWPTLYTEAFRTIKPGGYIEQLEWDVHFFNPDGSTCTDPIFSQLSRDTIDIGKKRGKTATIAREMAGLIGAAGFVDVYEKRFKWPIGPWASHPKLKEIGRWNLLSWEEGLEGWILAPYTRAYGWSNEQVQELIAAARATLRNRRVHVYQEITVVYARKPEDA